MPLELPELDDRGFAELVEETRRLIPLFSPVWTNHNPSDPGIALVELFAHITEMLLYRINRVTDDNQRKFLRLLNGPDWVPGLDLRADTRTAVLAVRARERAVTPDDYERLTLDDFNAWKAALAQADQAGGSIEAWWQVTRLDPTSPGDRPSALPGVARARCVPRRNLERGTEPERLSDAPSHVSVVIVPEPPPSAVPGSAQPQPPVSLTKAVWGYLDPRRVLTTRHHVVGPRNAPVRGEIVVARTANAVSAAVQSRVIDRLQAFLDPFGGPAAPAWPFGRDVFVSELIQQIESVEGVDYITDLTLTSTCSGTDPACVPATPIWHPNGELVGLRLAEHHLPQAGFLAADMVVAPSASFVPAEIKVEVETQGSPDPALLRRQLRDAARSFFHPLHGGHDTLTGSNAPRRLDALASTFLVIPGIAGVALDLGADESHLDRTAGVVTGLKVSAGQIVDWHLRIVGI